MLAGLLGFAGFGVVSGCAAQRVESPWCGEIQEEMSRLDKDSFQYQALSDCVVTEEEFGQALNNFKACAADAGIDVDISFTGGRYAGFSTASQDSETIRQCEEEHKISLEVFYTGMQFSPDRRDPFLEIVDCLKRHEVVPAGYSVEDYEKDLARDDAFSNHMTIHGDCSTYGAAG